MGEKGNDKEPLEHRLMIDGGVISQGLRRQKEQEMEMVQLHAL